MIVKRVAIRTAIGSVAIMQLVVQDDRSIDLLADRQAKAADMLTLPEFLAEAVEREISKLTASWASATHGSPELLPIQGWRFIDTVPDDRTYRDAWFDSGKTIEHDMAKAREIHRAKVREARAPMLRALDVEYQRADEIEDKPAKGAIATKKQLLRDAPADPRIEACSTVEELKALDVLSG